MPGRSPRPIYPSECCPNCGFNTHYTEPRDYACPKCGRFLDLLYRREHHNRRIGPLLTLAQIVAEYRAVGWPLPGWLPE